MMHKLHVFVIYNTCISCHTVASRGKSFHKFEGSISQACLAKCTSFKNNHSKSCLLNHQQLPYYSMTKIESLEVK